jgi:hypothetical protein
MRQNSGLFNRPPGGRRFSALLSRASSVQASPRAADHSHCIQPQVGTWTPTLRTKGFAVMAALAMLCRAGALGALLCSAANAAGIGCGFMGCPTAKATEIEARAVVKPACLNAAETRELVKSRHLLEPFAALKFAGAQRKAEALTAKLCRTGDDFFYEITLLHRDGRLVHVDMEAQTGKIASHPHEPHETHETHEAHEPHEAHDPHELPAKN